MTKIHPGCFEKVKNVWKDMDIFGKNQLGSKTVQGEPQSRLSSHRTCEDSKAAADRYEIPKLTQGQGCGHWRPRKGEAFQTTRGEESLLLLTLSDVFKAMDGTSRACPYPVFPSLPGTAEVTLSCSLAVKTGQWAGSQSDRCHFCFCLFVFFFSLLWPCSVAWGTLVP